MTIILEGPDGAGKTTLLSELHGHFPRMEQHPRFCTSTGGPIEELAEAVFKDVNLKPTHYLYDRHPVISDYIYNAAIPGRQFSPAFLSDPMGRVRNRVAHHSLTIWCLPPLPVIKRCLDPEKEMPGVVENIDRIYELYQMHRIMWPGRSVVYDYTHSAASWEGLRYILSDTVNKLWKEQP